jgi:serine-type D-Ala-D-Ala carboxypeptidase/endopeptidase
MTSLVRAAVFVAAMAATTHAARQGNPIDAMVADRLSSSPDAGIIVGTIDGTVTNIVARGKAALHADTEFEIGGLTEVFIAVALADMVAKREVDLRDPVAKHLPGVALPTRGGKSITLEDLAMHRSGLPRVLPGAGRSDANRYAAYTPARLGAFLEGYELPRDIGERYERSQVGTALLAAALTTRAAVPLEQLLHDCVITPLGLTATRMSGGALRSTPNDLAKFAAANLQTTGPLASALSDTRSSRGTVGAPGESLGLGWRIRHSGPRQIVWSSGGAGGHHVFIGLEPEAVRAVVVLHNQPLTIDDIGFNALEQLREAATPVDLVALRAFAGEYEIKRGLRVVVRVAGTRLAVQIGEEPESTLTQDSELRFVFNDSEARITFIRDPSGIPIGLMLHRGGQHIAARKLR